jgi:hypothetical protein
MAAWSQSANENTNHSKANKHFRVIIADWMIVHETGISGLNKNIPVLMQFDLLSDRQLISICKSADPIDKDREKLKS